MVSAPQLPHIKRVESAQDLAAFQEEGAGPLDLERPPARGDACELSLLSALDSPSQKHVFAVEVGGGGERKGQVGHRTADGGEMAADLLPPDHHTSPTAF